MRVAETTHNTINVLIVDAKIIDIRLPLIEAKEINATPVVIGIKKSKRLSNKKVAKGLILETFKSLNCKVKKRISIPATAGEIYPPIKKLKRAPR